MAMRRCGGGETRRCADMKLVGDRVYILSRPPPSPSSRAFRRHPRETRCARPAPLRCEWVPQRPRRSASSPLVVQISIPSHQSPRGASFPCAQTEPPLPDARPRPRRLSPVDPNVTPVPPGCTGWCDPRRSPTRHRVGRREKQDAPTCVPHTALHGGGESRVGDARPYSQRRSV